LDKSKTLGRLKEALKSIGQQGWGTEQSKEAPVLDLILRTPCYGAFFVIVDQTDKLCELYQEAQEQVAGLRSAGGRGWPRDLNLVLLLEATELSTESHAQVREILDDRLICRKHVLLMDGRQLDALLRELPFWPGGVFAGASAPVPGVDFRASLDSFDAKLVDDICGQRPGKDKIASNIADGIYELRTTEDARPPASPRRAPVTSGTRLAGLALTDFRGIRSLSESDMTLSGDVVVIYGANGVGKTSIVDALEWATTGKLWRVEMAARGRSGGADPIVNVFSDSGKARVVCHLQDRPSLNRETHGRGTVRLVGGEPVRDDRGMIDHIVGTHVPSGQTPLRMDLLRDLFRGSHLLAQHNMRRFLERTTPTERFDTLTNMIGADEFVRFRQKTCAVRRSLESTARSLDDRVAAASQDLEMLRQRVVGRKDEVQMIRAALSSKRSADELFLHLLAVSEQAGCLIDSGVRERLTAGPIPTRVGLAAVHVGAVINARKRSLATLLARVDVIEGDAPTQFRNLERGTGLAGDIGASAGSSQTFAPPTRGRWGHLDERRVRGGVEWRVQ